MATKRLTALQKFRKATVAQYLKYKQKTRTDKIRAAKKQADTDLVQRWRVLRKIGVYETKDTPALSRLTKARRAEIKKKFDAVQTLGQYEKGEVYRPLHKHEFTRIHRTYDDLGRITSTTERKYQRYEIDKDHFAVLKKKPKQVPGTALKTPQGMIVPKSPNEKIRITKDGKVEHVEIKGAAKTEFTREPLSGPVEFLTLIEDYKSGRLKFKNNEGLALWNNGKREVYYGQNAVGRMIAKLSRYSQNQGVRKFDDWSSNSEIAHVRRR